MARIKNTADERGLAKVDDVWGPGSGGAHPGGCGCVVAVVKVGARAVCFAAGRVTAERNGTDRRRLVRFGCVCGS